MGQLYLVRHAEPDVNPEMPSKQWKLSESGRLGALRAAVQLGKAGISKIFTSEEPKALETGRIIGGHHSIPVSARSDLGEHDRTGVGYLTPVGFRKAIKSLFSQPDDRVFGNESASEALKRFDRAVIACESELSDVQASLAIVSHGTVMSLFAGARSDREALGIWESLSMPAIIAMDRETRSVQEIVEHL